jgi:nicotinate dehydrogenase subunit A
MTTPVALKVNGQTHSLDVDPDAPLLQILRNDLGLKAAKFGCGLEQCGACKVLIDGEAMPSCALPVASVAQAEITTLENLDDHPLQRAFIAEQAAQCGYCTAGLIIAAKALLDRNPRPTRDDICRALDVHICRCGSHNRVIRAIQRAAKEIAP